MADRWIPIWSFPAGEPHTKIMANQQFDGFPGQCLAPICLLCGSKVDSVCVCVISLFIPPHADIPTRLGHSGRWFSAVCSLHGPILSPSSALPKTHVAPCRHSGASQSPSHVRQRKVVKEKTEEREKERNKESQRERKILPGGPALPPRLPLAPLDNPPLFPRAAIVTKWPIWVSTGKSTISVAFSWKSALTEGARWCFHPHAFSTSLPNFFICDRQVSHLTERCYLSCFSSLPRH